jgi:hypothetical protein
MARPSRYSADFRARALRLVSEARPDYDTEWTAITSVAHKLGEGGWGAELIADIEPAEGAVSVV